MSYYLFNEIAQWLMIFALVAWVLLATRLFKVIDEIFQAIVKKFKP